MQILNRTPSSRKDGVWGLEYQPEVTAYAILTLLVLSPLPWVRVLDVEINSAIRAGRKALSRSTNDWTRPQYIWVEKVTYGPAVLSEAYCLAAMNASTPPRTWSAKTKSILSMPTQAVNGLSLVFSRSYKPDIAERKINGPILERLLFLSQLESACTGTFPLCGRVQDERLRYISCAWTIVNDCEAIFLDAALLCDMMGLSLLNFLMDNYMKSTVARLPKPELESVHGAIDVFCQKLGHHLSKSNKQPPLADLPSLSSSKEVNISSTPARPARTLEFLMGVRNALRRYMKAILEHPRVRQASLFDQSNLRSKLQAFPHSHIVQSIENAFSSGQANKKDKSSISFLTPQPSFYPWVNATAAERISYPLLIAYFTCLVGSLISQEVDCFASASQKYLAHNLCSHPTIMSRLYNDYASIAQDRDRDRAKRYISSVDFPNFHFSRQNDES